MAFAIQVRLREGRYDAAGIDSAAPEWPPHPARLFCALVASVDSEADREALRWLETAGLPEVWATAEVATTRTSGYVVLNATGGRGSQTWPGRGSGLRQRSGVLPGCDTFAVLWPAEPDDATLARLVRLASQVPYVGRSTSSAEVTVVAAAVPSRPEWVRFAPVPLGRVASVPLRVPYAGYLDALEQAYADGVPAWHVTAPAIAYAAESETTDAPAAGVVDGPYADLLIWGLRRPAVPVRGDDLLSVTDGLRRAVLSRVADPLPVQVSGHGADGRPHVAYLGLLDVGHRHADGHLLGAGVAVPRQLPDADRRALLRGLLGADAADPMSLLRSRRGQRLELQYPPVELRGLDPGRWLAPDGARSWVTVTPLMLDRYPNRRHDLADVIAGSLQTAGYPAPAKVETLVEPVVRGAMRAPRPGSVPRWARKPMLHCRIEFAQPVRGPVIAGALRYLGSGLFVPEVEHVDR
ncbi:type I-U CRISPR-associated protein Cas5/Cas6 [Micromonospora zingiberis]|uniref:Type I-U CRISPR-associated protein Cas5/Cas6 n=1 Tax=Micromonospora zingiberis TaxID=2053011 RepID=A0A4R0G070_9ACTN|nr:type I-U CRISPR-associated protein Csb2 [Micromonospora zingiberis]TCB89406.1 type I-U CRISPR-associated protein Cas5/Cas6 [Micromonospora zingiberis]